MGSALIGGIAKSDITTPADITVYDPHAESVETLVNQAGVVAAMSNKDLAVRAETILLAVKPQYVAVVLAEIAELITPDHLLISIAAGVTVEKMEAN